MVFSIILMMQTLARAGCILLAPVWGVAALAEWGVRQIFGHKPKTTPPPAHETLAMRIVARAWHYGEVSSKQPASKPWNPDESARALQQAKKAVEAAPAARADAERERGLDAVITATRCVQFPAHPYNRDQVQWPTMRGSSYIDGAGIKDNLRQVQTVLHRQGMHQFDQDIRWYLTNLPEGGSDWAANIDLAGREVSKLTTLLSSIIDTAEGEKKKKK